MPHETMRNLTFPLLCREERCYTRSTHLLALLRRGWALLSPRCYSLPCVAMAKCDSAMIRHSYTSRGRPAPKRSSSMPWYASAKPDHGMHSLRNTKLSLALTSRCAAWLRNAITARIWAMQCHYRAKLRLVTRCLRSTGGSLSFPLLICWHAPLPLFGKSR